MRVGILCAGDREAAPFLPLIKNDRITEKAMLAFHQGQLNGVDTVTLFSGVCKVNAAVAAQLLIEAFGVDAIINAGTAGGMDERLHLFDTAICTEAVYHDVAPHILTGFHPWMETEYFKADPHLLQLSRQAVKTLGMENRVYWGRMATGEAFVDDGARETINRQYAPLTVDMETAGIAHVCHANSVPFLAIRTVTDTADHSGAEHFEINCAQAAATARDITMALLAELKKEA